MSCTFIKPGDIVGFSGRNLTSDWINCVTGGIPRYGISHVGIIGDSGGRRYLFEAGGASAWCEISQEAFCGFQAHFIEDVLGEYNGRIWLYPLYRRLYQHEDYRLSAFLHGSLGTPYDRPGAIRSGGFVWGGVNALARRESLCSLFCSEVVAAAESRIGIFPTSNASRWNPNKLIRTMRRDGLLRSPEEMTL